MQIIATFIANAQAAKLMQPAERPFHHPTVLAEATAVRRVPLRQDRLNAQPTQDLTMRLGIIAAVSLDTLGATSRMADFASHGGNRLHERHQLSDIVRIRPVRISARGMPRASVMR